MKNTALLRFLFTFLLIGLFSCEQSLLYEEVPENTDTVAEVQQGPQLNYVTDVAIPDIMAKLTNRVPKNEIEQTTSKLSFNDVDIDLEKIMEVVANGNETKYTFGLDVKNAPEHHLYNLVMGKDANGNLTEPYVIGYEMEPDDMTAFLESGEDFGQFKSHFRYYTFDSFFADSKLNQVGKNGDCGDGTVGGSGASETPAGGSFSHTYNGLTITNIFGPNAVQIPYGYSVSITGSDGSTSTATTNTTAAVNTITAGVASTGSTQVIPNPPNSSITTDTTHVNFGVSSEGFGPSGPGVTCYYTITVIGNITITETNCVENSQKYSSSTNKNTDCPDTDGANGISTAGRPVLQLIGYLGSNFMKSRKTFLKGNKHIAQLMVDYIVENGETQEAKEFVKWNIQVLSEHITTGQVHDYEKSLNVMSAGLRKFHGEDGALFADYIDAVIPELNDMTVSEVQDFHAFAKEITNDFTDSFHSGILIAYKDGLIKPVFQMVLFEVGGGLAIKLLQKVPIAWVFRGSKLNEAVLGASQMGVQGVQAHVKIVSTSSPLYRARGLFNVLSKHAVSKTAQANGTVVANMGNGNYITFRTISSSGFDATISFNFRQVLGTNNFVLKFTKL